MKIHPKETYKQNDPPNKNIVCTNNLRTISTNCPLFPFKQTESKRKNLRKSSLVGWAVYWMACFPMMTVLINPFLLQIRGRLLLQ